MSSKDVKFSTDARDRMLKGITTLSNAVRITLGPRGAMSSWTNPTARRASPRTV